jgi:gamma-tubulin complex component 2
MNQSYQSPLCFGQKIALRNMHNHRYLKVVVPTGQISATGVHPTLSYSGCDSILQFTILSCTSGKDYRGIVSFNSKIMLLASENSYLSYTASKEVLLEHEEPSSFQKSDSGAKNSIFRWILVDPSEDSGKRAVSFYDQVVLRTPFGELTTDPAGAVTTGGQGAGAESVWKVLKASVPFIPDWVFSRPFLAHNDLVLARSSLGAQGERSPIKRRLNAEDKGGLGKLPAAAQEKLLMEDLLYALISVEGIYIKRRSQDLLYAVEPYLESPSCDESLLYMVNNILPACEMHDKVCVFVNLHMNFESGLVSHALCEAIGLLLKEYKLKIAQLDMELEKGELTLQKLWFYVQPCMRTLECLGKFVEEAESLKGGALLNSIYKSLTAASDAIHKKIFNFLLEKASVPYLEILSKWIYLGEIEDPYEEFLIKENKELSKENLNKDFNDRYWDSRFELRDSQTPLFLHKLAAKVLLTGKYLNVIRECGKTVHCPYLEELDPRKNTKLLSNIGSQREFLEPIEHAYEWASKELLQLILGEHQLVNRLKSIKHYFFLDHGDFFVHFMDSAQEELEKHHENVSKEKLESLLDLSLRTSSTNSDSFKDDLSCELHTYTLMEQLYAIQISMGNQTISDEMSIFAMAQKFKGLEIFVLDYKVQWPLTLITSRKALTRYQLIFRHLFFCKYVERRLGNTWILHQSTKEISLHKAFSTSYCLRQRMLHFVKNYVYYVTVEVLEDKWHRFLEGLKTVQTVDNIMNLHNMFLDECLKESLLMDHELIMSLHKIISFCLNFSEMIENHAKTLRADESLIGQFGEGRKKERTRAKWADGTGVAESMLARKKYEDMIDNYSLRFDEHLSNFLKTIDRNRSRSETHLINLIIRLDYNDYYSGIRKMLDERN